MQDEHPRPTPDTSRLGQIFGILAWLIGWAIYDGFVFGIGTAAAILGQGGAAIAAWSFVAILATLPGLAFAGFFTGMLVNRNLRPSNRADLATLAAQLFGLFGLACAVAVPVLVLRSYYNPSAEIRVDNRTAFTSSVTVSDHGNCEGGDYARAGTTTTVRVDYGGLFGQCIGFKATDIEIFNALGRWRCDWHDAKSHEPLVLTDEGPNCTPTSYTPGLLRQTPTTGGPPFSPPSR